MPISAAPDHLGNLESGGISAIKASAWLWIAPAFLAAFFILRFGVAVPFWDDIKTARGLCPDIDHGGFTWSQLLSQDNESRPVFPRFVFLAVARLTHWDQRWVMACSWMVMVFSAFTLHGLAAQTLRPTACAGVSVVAGILIFRLSQWQNLLWAHQFMVLVPAASLFFSLWIQKLRWPWAVRWFLVSAAGLVATYSFANGMLLWLLLPIGMLFAPSQKLTSPEEPQRWLATVGVLIIGVLSTLFYFRGFTAVEQPTIRVWDLPELFAFTLGFIGDGICNWLGRPTAIALGLVGLLIAIACGITLLRSAGIDRKNNSLELSVPWALLCAYSLISGAMTSVGRHSYGLAEFAEARYFSFAVPFWIGLLPLVYFSCGRTDQSLGGFARRVPIIFAACIVLLTGMDLFRAWGAGGRYQQDRQCGQMLCAFSPVVIDADSFKQYVWGKEDAADTAATITELGKRNLLCFPLETRRFAQEYFPTTTNSLEKPLGQFEKLGRTSTGLKASGWAVQFNGRKKVDAVLIAAVQADGRSRLIGVCGQTFLPRPDLSSQDRHLPVNRGWSVVLHPGTAGSESVPPGAMLEAYVFEAASRTLQRIPGSFAVP